MEKNLRSKRSSDKPVEGTNDCSTVSKFSASSMKYFSDIYLKYFVPKPARRAPLINRGYYIRWKATDDIKSVCKKFFSDCYLQFILLGSGYDTSVFQLLSDKSLQWKVYEVDFPAVQNRKLDIICHNQQLLQCTGELNNVADGLVQSAVYSAISCDICDLTLLSDLLKTAGVDFAARTILLAECSLTYINARSVDALLTWCGVTFPNALFCTYEQIQPQDSFGKIMLEHFNKLNTPLQNLHFYTSQESQCRRYLKAGWDICQSCDMNFFFNHLPEAEKERIRLLELFDEYEEWHQKCTHYIMVCAFKGQMNVLKNKLLPGQQTVSPSLCLLSCTLNREKVPFNLKRYSHGSCQLPSGAIVIVGGFGESMYASKTPHSRLRDVLMLQKGTHWNYSELKTIGNGPGSLVHHTVTAIADGSKLLIIGGRHSPANPNDAIYELKINFNVPSPWVRVLLHPDSLPMKSRWRHSANAIQIDGVGNVVIIVGGSSTCSTAMSDILLLNTTTWKLKQVAVSLPEGRCSHSTAVYKDGIVICGGMNNALQPLSSCLYLCCNNPDMCSISTINFSIPLPPKYGMAAVVFQKYVILVGGVSQLNSPDIIILNLELQVWLGAKVTTCFEGVPLLQKHTCHIVNNKKIMIIGGGGNCFSFGTHINSAFLFLDISSFIF